MSEGILPLEEVVFDVLFHRLEKLPVVLDQTPLALHLIELVLVYGLPELVFETRRLQSFQGFPALLLISRALLGDQGFV